MATSKGNNYVRPRRRYLQEDLPAENTPNLDWELEEFDVYNGGRVNSVECRKPAVTSRGGRKKSSSSSGESVALGGAPGSLPVNIPDWSKILKSEYGGSGRKARLEDFDGNGGESDDSCCDGGEWVPPHEYLARQMERTSILSSSVQEGAGRTLKGRDLSRVRNAIWAKTGFQD